MDPIPHEAPEYKSGTRPFLILPLLSHNLIFAFRAWAWHSRTGSELQVLPFSFLLRTLITLTTVSSPKYLKALHYRAWASEGEVREGRVNETSKCLSMGSVVRKWVFGTKEEGLQFTSGWRAEVELLDTPTAYFFLFSPLTEKSWEAYNSGNDPCALSVQVRWRTNSSFPTPFSIVEEQVSRRILII